MPQYIAFLRAINVGGRMVKMEDLKKILAMPGIKNVSTYIQSGNVVFESKETNRDALAKKIETKLEKSLGFEVKTLLRTMPDMEAIINQTPFKKYAEDMAQHVSFLSQKADGALVEQLQALQTEFEQFRFIDTEAYILVRKGAYGETKFSNNFLEKKLKLYATTRNWATVNKMLEYKTV
jgi:uncharacterized protein (DUF1697 family)